MRLLISSLAAAMIFCALVVLLGCDASSGNTGNNNTAKATATPPQPTAQPQVAGDGAARISVTDLRAALDKGTAVVVDVRNDDQFNAGHIKGAVHIPEMDIAARSGELPSGKTIVTYCS
ncbi:MAG: rhodanese-like domain-containing protein [Pyrinomonadaceae bacterium]